MCKCTLNCCSDNQSVILMWKTQKSLLFRNCNLQIIMPIVLFTSMQTHFFLVLEYILSYFSWKLNCSSISQLRCLCDESWQIDSSSKILLISMISTFEHEFAGSMSMASYLNISFIILFSHVVLFGAAPMGYGSFQARGLIRTTPQLRQHQIWYTSATYIIACSNAGSLTHWVRPGIKSASSCVLIRYLASWATTGTPIIPFWCIYSICVLLMVATIICFLDNSNTSVISMLMFWVSF